MCGIAGIFDTVAAGPIDPALLARMTDTLHHRGPDDSGFHVAPGIGLGHRRLSIIDLSALGRQPLFNEDGTVCVSFNGEIYNFPELYQELHARGHKFRSRCDTEVIVHAWEEWGEGALARLNGMFAFAIWDEPKQTLFLARDRFGEKPLYYSRLDDGKVVFGSELKALLVHPGVRRRLDPQAVADYFAYGYVPDPRSIYRDIFKLPPAHSLTLRRGAPVPAARQYWSVQFHLDHAGSAASLSEELVDRLRRAVGMRMAADVPLGAFLSGGVDSSTVVALMATQSRDPVSTCSIGFDDPSYDESLYAQTVAERYRADHFSRTVATDDFALIDLMSTIYDEPFADSSALPTYLVCGLARERVTVALSGDGGDEIFGGYRRYGWHAQEHRLRSILPAPLGRPLFGLASGLAQLPFMPSRIRTGAIGATLRNLRRSPAEAYFDMICVANQEVAGRFFSAATRREMQGYRPLDLLARHMAEAQTDDCLAQVQYADIRMYLPGDILTKVDRASMAHSLEVRVPLLDHELVQWTANLPSALKRHAGEGKYLLKKAMEPYLPQDVLYRPKMGFAVPLAAWFRGPLAERARRLASAGALVESGMFDVGFLGRLIEDHQARRRDHGPAIWSLLIFEAFLSRVHSGSALA